MVLPSGLESTHERVIASRSLLVRRHSPRSETGRELEYRLGMLYVTALPEFLEQGAQGRETGGDDSHAGLDRGPVEGRRIVVFNMITLVFSTDACRHVEER